MSHLPQRFGGASFVVDLADSISREAYFTGLYEPVETALFAAIVKPGMTIIDIGANWGYFTLLAAGLMQGAGRVISVEPDSRLASRLQENADINAFDRVEIVRAAASDSNGHVAFDGYADGAENRGVSRVVRQGNSNARKVASVCIDDLCARLKMDACDFLKMDIEGGEQWALNGMVEGLKRHFFHRILLELHPEEIEEQGGTIEQCLHPLTSSGYRGWAIKHEKNDTRRAAYSQRVDLSEYLTPFLNSASVGLWPHVLWLAPDVNL